MQCSTHIEGRRKPAIGRHILCLYSTVYIPIRLSNPVWNYNGTTAFYGVEQREVDSRFLVCKCQINAQQIMAQEIILAKETMSSIEVSELTGREHKNVMRDIRDLLDQGVSQLNFEPTSYKDKQGKERPCYNLTKKGCLILASGYNAVLREKIINRWEDLETGKSQPASIKSKREPSLTTKVRVVLEWVKGVSELLNLNESSKLSLLGKVAKPLDLPLPDYTPSKGVLKSASELLKERGLQFIPVNDRSIKTKWTKLFAASVSKEDRKKVHFEQFRWHLFSFNLLEALTNDDARAAFDAEPKDTVYLFWQHTEKAYLVENAHLFKAEDFDHDFIPHPDFYLFNPERKWTYIHTHEIMCGPYFYKLP